MVSRNVICKLGRKLPKVVLSTPSQLIDHVFFMDNLLETELTFQDLRSIFMYLSSEEEISQYRNLIGMNRVFQAEEFLIKKVFLKSEAREPFFC